MISEKPAQVCDTSCLPASGERRSPRRPAKTEEPSANVELPADRRMLSLAAAAEKMGCSREKLKKMINRGEAPAFVQLGRDISFRESTVDAWLAKRERESLKLLKQNREFVEKFARATPGGLTAKTTDHSTPD